MRPWPSRGTRARAACPGETFDGDVRDAAALARAAAGCDAICHSAALVSVWRKRREDFDDVNVGGLRHVLDAARAAGIGRIVYTSSFLALPPAGAVDAGPLERLPADEGRWPTSWPSRAVADGAPLIRVYPGRDLRPRGA